MPAAPAQGDVALVRVKGGEGAREVAGALGGRPLSFFPHGEGHAALAGIDLETPPGPAAWSVTVVDDRGGMRQASGTLTVRAKAFPIQRLTVPRHMVDLDPEIERRADAESERLNALYDTLTPERLWRGAFVPPMAVDTPGQAFGARRIINGQPRRPHAGRDYAAERGTPVMATNRGRVALVADFFFPGRMVALDHGLGLYTLYMHLDRVDVEEGMLVQRGARLGAVGATGRATGPHLHWGAQLGRARIDPETLLRTRVDE